MGAFMMSISVSNATSTATELCLINNTPYNLFVQVNEIDNYDWDGSSRPDHNWNNVTLSAGSTRCRRAEVNTEWPHFTFIFNHRYIYRMARAFTDQGHARWSWLNKSLNDRITLSGDNGAKVTLVGYENYTPGELCDVTNLKHPRFCQKFTISVR
jgi:hypothetical protein